MADGMNRWLGLGNLTEAAELRFTQSGQAVLNFRIACSESYADKDGARKERVEYVSCVLWGKRGESLSKFLEKGKQVLVEGRLETQKYEKDGQTRYRTQIVVLDLRLLGSGRGGAPAGGHDESPRGAPRAASSARSAGRSGAAPRTAPVAVAGDDDGGYDGSVDDDVPF